MEAPRATLLPHVARTLRISDLLAMRETEAADLAAAVEGLASGMVLVDASLGVRGANPAARRLIGAIAGLAVEGGRLRLAAHGPGAELATAIAACAEGRIDRAGASILFDRDDAPGLVAHVLPLARPRSGLAVGGGAVAALFLTNPVEPGRPPMDSVVRRFGLTPSETRVLLGVLEGRPRGRRQDGRHGASGPGADDYRTDAADLTARRGLSRGWFGEAASAAQGPAEQPVQQRERSLAVPDAVHGTKLPLIGCAAMTRA